MSKTTIEWTNRDGPGHTWNPIKARLKEPVEIHTSKGLKVIPAGKVGYHCEHSSPGCLHCYAESMNGRCLPAWGTGLKFNIPNRERVEIFLDEKVLLEPFGWKAGTTAFVCSMTDLFADFVPDAMIERVCAVIALCSGVTFQVLTKRSKRMAEFFADEYRWIYIEGQAQKLYSEMHPNEDPGSIAMWLAVHGPLKNLWLGVSVENQKYADERIPLLLKTTAAIRFVSYEPALGPVDFSCIPWPPDWQLGIDDLSDGFDALRFDDSNSASQLGKIDWIIGGSESGHGARPAEEDWMRSVKNQCVAAGTAFFYKQSAIRGRKIPTPELDGQKWIQFPCKP